jgi:hypothetical protein
MVCAVSALSNWESGAGHEYAAHSSCWRRRRNGNRWPPPPALRPCPSLGRVGAGVPYAPYVLTVCANFLQVACPN